MKKLLSALTAAVILAVSSSSAVLGAGNISPLMTFSLTENTEILGLTSWDSLGKRTGTLEEFAASVPKDGIMTYTAFPANFFHSYDDVKDVIGGIYSQGRIVYDNWMDWGCGFDTNNNFRLFSLISTISNEPGGMIMAKDEYGNDVEIVTAFNCYPWLIKDGVPLDIYPFPGADASFLNASSQRAFMGQKADGTFLYGMVGGTTMTELRDICVELGLINAVNTDGGASCGVYTDGQYLAVPGRELASVVYIAEKQPEITVIYNGAKIEFSQPPVFRNGYAFYPLEDVLTALCGFHGWNPAALSVYGSLNGNTVEVPLMNPGYVVNGAVSDIPAELVPFVENERTYVYLDYIVQGLGLSLTWDGALNTVTISNY